MYPKDFYKVKEFYEKVLGYPIVDGWDSPEDKGAMFDTGAAIIEVMTPRKGLRPPVQAASLSLMVEDVWALWEKLKDHPNILKPLSAPSSWGDVGFKIADPEGFQITFFTPNSKKPR